MRIVRRDRESSAVAFRVFLALTFRVFFGISSHSKASKGVGRGNMCFHLHYSKFSGGFRAFSGIFWLRRKKISRLVED